MTHPADSDPRPRPLLPTPGGLALSTLLTTAFLLAAVFGVSAAVDALTPVPGGSGPGPALLLVPLYAVQRIAAVHRGRPAGRRRAAWWSLAAGAAVGAVLLAGGRLAAAGLPVPVVLACAYVVALPSAAAVYAWLLTPARP